MNNLCRALEVTGATKRCLNLSSYNYLGFAAADEYCTPRVQEVLKQYGASMCSSRLAAGEKCACNTSCNVQQALVIILAMLINTTEAAAYTHLILSCRHNRKAP